MAVVLTFVGWAFVVAGFLVVFGLRVVVLTGFKVVVVFLVVVVVVFLVGGPGGPGGRVKCFEH